MGGFEHDARDRVVDAAAHAGDLASPGVHDLSCAWYIITMPVLTRWLTTARADGAVDVEQLDPVVVLDARLGVVLAEPNHRAAAVERQHHQVVAVGAVDAPLLVRRDEVEQISAAVGLAAQDVGVVFRSTGGR